MNKIKIKLIIGLGNPGKEYKNTRHNMGFLFVDALAKKLNAPEFIYEKKLKAEISKSKVLKRFSDGTRWFTFKFRFSILLYESA